MQATTFRLGALVALVGALPAPLDDASDIARLTIKKHKKHLDKVRIYICA